MRTLLNRASAAAIATILTAGALVGCGTHAEHDSAPHTTMHTPAHEVLPQAEVEQIVNSCRDFYIAEMNDDDPDAGERFDNMLAIEDAYAERSGSNWIVYIPAAPGHDLSEPWPCLWDGQQITVPAA